MRSKGFRVLERIERVCETLAPFKQFSQKLGFVSGGFQKDLVWNSLSQHLNDNYQKLIEVDSANEEHPIWEQLDWLLSSQEQKIRHSALTWIFRQLDEQSEGLPSVLQLKFLERVKSLNDHIVLPYLLGWLSGPGSEVKLQIPGWLAEIDYPSSEERQRVISALLTRYLDKKNYGWVNKPLLKALVILDQIDGEVTDITFHRFPQNDSDANQMMICLLGQTGRYRVVKPLIVFAGEYPEYLRHVEKALSDFNYDEVDQFFMGCLNVTSQSDPIILLEAVKQIRKRRLKKAACRLEEIFPLEDSSSPLINRKINSEIALTLGSFGSYGWAREKLLPEMILNGVNSVYLKTINQLNLQEAVPLLKAILLLPETAEISLIQYQSFQVCQRLLTL